jgi:hypothetical protein
MVLEARPDMTRPEIEAQIHALEALGTAELRVRWSEAYGAPPPARWSSKLLVRGLAHRIQEDALGGLAPELRGRLADLAARLAHDPNASSRPPRRLQPGTRLIREWRRERHQVTVLDDGFAYRDQRYRSLSAIARVITGTRWSGPAFFGLAVRRRAHRNSHG